MVYIFHSIDETETVKIFAAADNQDSAMRISIDLYEMGIKNFCVGIDANVLNFAGVPGFEKNLMSLLR